VDLLHIWERSHNGPLWQFGPAVGEDPSSASAAATSGHFGKWVTGQSPIYIICSLISLVGGLEHLDYPLVI